MLKISIKTMGQKFGYNNEKEKFSAHIRSKLHPKRDGLVQVLEWINPNTYKEDIANEFITSDTFNVSNFSMFEVNNDSRLNHFEEMRGWWKSTSIPKWAIKSVNWVIDNELFQDI